MLISIGSYSHAKANAKCMPKIIWASESLYNNGKPKTVKKTNVIRSKERNKTHFLLQSIGWVENLGHSNGAHILSVRELLRVTQRHTYTLDSLRRIPLNHPSLELFQRATERGERSTFGFKGDNNRTRQLFRWRGVFFSFFFKIIYSLGFFGLTSVKT